MDELTDEPKEGEKVKSYWNGKKKEGNIPSGALSETANKRVDVLQKIRLEGATLQGPSREGFQVSREGWGLHKDIGKSRRSSDLGGRKDTQRHLNHIGMQPRGTLPDGKSGG